MESIYMRNSVHGAEEILGYHFTDPWLLWEALQAAGTSVHVIGNRIIVGCNKRLAVLGGRVLDLALAEAWHEGDDAPVRFDQIQQQVGSNANLDRIGRETGLVAFVNQDLETSVVVFAGTMSATVRAILGAVYLNSDMHTVKRVMDTLGLVPT